MKWLFIFFITGFTISATAQVRIGGFAGVHSSGIGNKDLVSTSRQTNLHAGLMADFKIPKSDFHILAQALYAPLGYTKSNLAALSNSGNQLGQIDRHHINYIQVPAYFSYAAVSKKATICAGLGPFVAFKTGDKLKIKGGDTFGNGTVLPSGVKSIKPVLAGLGVQFSSAWSSFLLALHLQQSFTDIYENQAGNAKWKVNSFGLSVGYFFSK